MDQHIKDNIVSHRSQVTKNRADFVFRVIATLTAHYENKYTFVPGKAKVNVSLMFNNYSVHILIDGKLKETVSRSHLKEIIN